MNWSSGQARSICSEVWVKVQRSERFIAADVGGGGGQVTALDALMISQSWLAGSPNCRKTISTLKKVRKKLK